MYEQPEIDREALELNNALMTIGRGVDNLWQNRDLVKPYPDKQPSCNYQEEIKTMHEAIERYRAVRKDKSPDLNKKRIAEEVVEVIRKSAKKFYNSMMRGEYGSRTILGDELLNLRNELSEYLQIDITSISDLT